MSKIPSIAMIPSAYKSGKVYSVLPSDGSGDLNFTRTSEATRVNEDGLIETVGSNVPRIDYKDGGCPKLLLEPASTNLALWSENFSNAVWSTFDVTKEPNTIIDPSGNLTGCRVTALAGSNRVIQQIVNITADPTNDRTYTGSLWIKSPNATSCQIRVGVAVSNTTITISDEWQRFDAQYVLDATFTFIRLGIVVENDGDIVDVAFGQIEEQSYATSYIPTNGGTVTREAETASKSGLSSYINSQEGVLYFEGSVLDISTSNSWISLYQSSSYDSNQFNLRFIVDQNFIQVVTRGQDLGQDLVMDYSINDKTDTNKIAVRYNLNNWSLWVNGVEVVTGTSTNLFDANSLDAIAFDRGNDTKNFYGNVKDLRVYNQALTDTELEEMTGFKSFVQMANYLNYTVI